jgi:DNA invertase Pin-like site-specific DNA recombinase
LINNNPEWQFVEVYADQAITGTKTNKRTDFNRMINDCMNGEIDLVIVKNISRFARNTLDTLQYVRVLKEKGVAVLFEEENINTLTMDGELLLTILSSVAQQEVQNISEHVKLGLSMKMQRGQMVGFNGCLGYDYNQDDKSITVNEEEAETVRYIFSRYCEGAGGKVIARELKNLGFKTKRGDSNFSESGIIRIIKNEKYKGDLLMGKTFTTDPISKRRLSNLGESDQYYIENHHEAIVSKDVWDKANDILNKRRGSYVKDNGKRDKFSRQFSFSCMLKCGFCGGNLTRRSWNSNTEYQKTVWQCVKATKHGKKECPYCKGISEELLEKAFVRAYNALCTYDGEFIDGFIEHVKLGLENNNTDKELKSISKKMSKLKERKSSLVDMYVDKKIDEETYQTKVEEVNRNLDELLVKKQSLKDKQQDRQDINKRLSEFQNVISKGEALQSFDRHVFESITDRIVVGEKGENGEINPYKLKIIFKTGYERYEVADEQPFSFANSCSNTSYDCGIISLQGCNGTCGDLCVAIQTQFLEILDFTLFFDHFVFTPNAENVLEKELKKEIPVSVGIELVSGDMSENA